MLDSFANYFWTHPVVIAGGGIAVIIILIWMTGSGSRQRFIVFKRSKETDQLARDLSRIAAALERIARSRETPTDYVGRPIPPGWEEGISAGEPAEDLGPLAPAIPSTESVEAAMAAGAHGNGVDSDESQHRWTGSRTNAHDTNSDAANSAQSTKGLGSPRTPERENQPTSSTNPLGRTADLLGKKKLDIPNPLYRPK